MSTSRIPTREGALPFSVGQRFEMTLLQVNGSDVPFNLVAIPPAVVIPGQPPSIDLRNIHQPALITVHLVGELVEAKDVRFHANPHDAMHFGHGTLPPTGPGNAGGMFIPIAVSGDRRELTFRAANPGDAQDYRGMFRYTFNDPASSLASASGGPIIIND